MTIDEYKKKAEESLLDPKPGLCAGGVKEVRKVIKRFDHPTTGVPYVGYTKEHYIPLEEWQEWVRSTEAQRILAWGTLGLDD